MGALGQRFHWAVSYKVITRDIRRGIAIPKLDKARKVSKLDAVAVPELDVTKARTHAHPDRTRRGKGTQQRSDAMNKITVKALKARHVSQH